MQAWDKQAPYGSTFKHIQDRAQNVAAHVQDGSFDAVRPSTRLPPLLPHSRRRSLAPEAPGRMQPARLRC